MKMNHFHAALAALLALAACTAELDTDVKVPESGRLRARLEGETDTRVEFDTSSGKLAWTNGDVIDIHTSLGAYRTAELDATGGFSLELAANEARDGYAVYPSGIVGGSGSGLTLTLPTSYDLDASNSMLDKAPLIAVNDPSSDDLWFYHAAGTIYLTLNEIPANTASIAVIFDKRVTGVFDVQTPASGHPYIETDGAATGTTVTFNLAAPLSVATDGILVKVPVPVGNYATINAEARDGSDAVLKTYRGGHSRTMYRARGRKISLPEPLDSMQLVVKAGDETAWTFTIPFIASDTLPGDLSINWGDGTITRVPAGATVSEVSSNLNHTYNIAGEYPIKVTAYSTDNEGYCIPNLRFYGSGSAYTPFQNSRKMLVSLPTALLKMKGDGTELFRSCTKLNTLSPDLFEKNPSLTSFQSTFYGCSGLTKIPAGLFDNCENVTTFESTFYGCSGLTTIPAGLFDNCENVTTFKSTFYDCTGLTAIPAELFYKCTNVTSFRATFYGCSGLTAIPEGLFDKCTNVTSFQTTFSYCSGITAIPAELFYKCTNVTSFENTFSGCSGLTAIPPELFYKCTNVTSFLGTFWNCKGLTAIPAGLFDKCTLVTTFQSTFGYCSGLTAIPAKLFDNCPKVTSFQSTFYNCSGLIAIPAKLFDNCPKVTSFQSTFSWCTGLTTIPANLFDKCTQVSSFESTFQRCKNWIGPIPAGFFDNCTNVWSFKTTFEYCMKLTGPIPQGLFDNCTKVNSFEDTFANCLELSGAMPSGLFSHNIKATSFRATFINDHKLTLVTDVFTGGTDYTPATRFTVHPYKIDFTQCFSGMGGGTAPNLWEYTFGGEIESYLCFENCARLTNYASIPSGWK